MNPAVDDFLVNGCGRCELGGTPECKVNNWVEELKFIRLILLESELTEELKWGFPCYTYQKSNVILVGTFKEYCSISFLKGILLKDKKNLLTKPGENSQSVRLFRFTSVDEILAVESDIKAYIKEAIEIEKSGKKVDFKQKNELVYPEELVKLFDENLEFKQAFDALTPGRKRGYNLYFSAPKQSKTKEARILKYLPKILEGKGFFD